MKMQFFASLCLPPPPLKVSFVLCDVIKDLNSDTHIEHTINHRVNNVNSTEIAEEEWFYAGGTWFVVLHYCSERSSNTWGKKEFRVCLCVWCINLLFGRNTARWVVWMKRQDQEIYIVKILQHTPPSIDVLSFEYWNSQHSTLLMLFFYRLSCTFIDVFSHESISKHRT